MKVSDRNCKRQAVWMIQISVISVFVLILISPKQGLAIQNCADAPLTRPQQWQQKELRLMECVGEYDGDYKQDYLQIEYDNSGSQFSSYGVEIKLSLLGKTSITAVFDFSRMINTVDIPNVLMKPKLRPLKEIIEKILFQKTYPRPDASMLRLLHANGAPAWHNGGPKMPENYAVTTVLPSRSAEKGKHTSAKLNAVWMYYMGINHRRTKSSKLSARFRVLASQGDRVAYGSAHGVVIYDKKLNRHAWMYVFPGGYKLRHPSIKSAEMAESKLSIKLNNAGHPLPTEVFVDMKSGELTRRLQ